MELLLNAHDGAIPVAITLDDDNGRYMIRKSDTSGEVFDDALALIKWARVHMHEQDFVDPNAFRQVMNKLLTYEIDARAPHN